MARQNARASDAPRMATAAIPSRPRFGFLPSMLKLRWAGPSRFTSTSGKQLTKIEPEEAEGVDTKVKPCIDSMRTSSPTRLRPIQARPSPGSPDQDPWIILHPSALNMFGKITNAARGKQVVMFLDYDGTLSPIVEDPDRAFMSSQMREAVRDSAKYFPTAIVSGRSREKVYNFVKLPELYYAGSHGMDIKGPSKSHSIAKRDNKEILFQPASEFLPMIDEVYKALIRKTKSIQGAKVESNKFCCSVHYRCVDEKWWGFLAEQVRLVLNDYPKLKLTQGRKVLEIRPIIKWDKGKALEFLLESLGFSNSSDVLPIYIGDDRTDEDAFKILRDRGQGIGILVTKGPRDTYASHTLQDPSEVMGFLRRLVEWKKFSPNTAQSTETCRMNHATAIRRGASKTFINGGGIS